VPCIQHLSPSNAPAGPQPVAESLRPEVGRPALAALQQQPLPELSLFERTRLDEAVLVQTNSRVGCLARGQAANAVEQSAHCPGSDDGRQPAAMACYCVKQAIRKSVQLPAINVAAAADHQFRSPARWSDGPERSRGPAMASSRRRSGPSPTTIKGSPLR